MHYLADRTEIADQLDITMGTKERLLSKQRTWSLVKCTAV